MVRVTIPLGKSTTSFEVPKANLLGIIEPLDIKGVADLKAEIKRALAKPLGKPLRKLARPGQRVAIVVTDHTRPCPDHLILPVVLEELRAAGVSPKDIVVVIGTGVHRKMKPAEMCAKFGKLDVEVVNHDPRRDLVYLGETRTGGKVYINRKVAEADLVVGVGLVEPHQYAGWSGGRKLVAVGVAGEQTIAHTHQPRFIDHPQARPGNLAGNSFHRELCEMARKTRLQFVVNVVLNARQELVGCFAGDPIKSFERAAKIARHICVRPVPQQADILVLGVGHPKDIDLYQASRGVTYACAGARPAVRRGGIVILAAACPEGVGDVRFERLLKRAESPAEVVAKSKRRFEPGEQRAYMLARVLKRVRVVVAGSALPARELCGLFLESVPTVQQALACAFGVLGRDSKVLVVPHSLLTVPVVG